MEVFCTEGGREYDVVGTVSKDFAKFMEEDEEGRGRFCVGERGDDIDDDAEERSRFSETSGEGACRLGLFVQTSCVKCKDHADLDRSKSKDTVYCNHEREYLNGTGSALPPKTRNVDGSSMSKPRRTCTSLRTTLNGFVRPS